MKKIYTKGMVWLIVLAIPVCFQTGCKSKQEAVKKVPGEEEIVRYCYGPDYQTDKEHFRASASGESMDQMMSEKKAVSEARSKLAAQIETTVKTVTDNYGKSAEMNKKEDLMKRYETLSREVINQKLPGTREICNKQTKTKEGNYKTYVTIELGGTEVLNALNSKMSNDDIIKIDYNYEKFKKTFEDEMNKAESK